MEKTKYEILLPKISFDGSVLKLILNSKKGKFTPILDVIWSHYVEGRPKLRIFSWPMREIFFVYTKSHFNYFDIIFLSLAAPCNKSMPSKCMFRGQASLFIPVQTEPKLRTIFQSSSFNGNWNSIFRFIQSLDSDWSFP